MKIIDSRSRSLCKLLVIGSLIISSIFLCQSQQVPGGEDLILPIFVSGLVGNSTHFETRLTFLNLADSNTTGFGKIYDNNGVVQPAGECDAIQIPKKAFSFEVVPNGIFHSAEYVPNGWARVTVVGGSDRIQLSAEISWIKGALNSSCLPVPLKSSDEIITTVRIPAVKPAKKFRVFTPITPNRRTAIAIVNPSETMTAIVQLQLTRASEPDSKITLSIPPLTRLSKFLLELVVPQGFPPDGVPELFPHFLGSATITSDIPIAVGVLHVLLPEGKLVGVPVNAFE